MVFFLRGGGVTLPRTQTPCLSSSSRAVESKGKQAGLGTILQAFILGGRYSAKPSDAVVTRPATAPAFTGLPEQQDRGQIHSLAMPGGCALRPSHPESMAPGLCTDANSGQASRPPAPRCHPLYGSGPASPLTSPPQTPPPYLLSSSHTGLLCYSSTRSSCSLAGLCTCSSFCSDACALAHSFVYLLPACCVAPSLTPI